MATINEFARKWHKVNWTTEGNSGPIPHHAFPHDGTGTLRITISSPPILACDLSWNDEYGHPCSIKVLPFHEANGTLQSDAIEVRFRTPGGDEYPVELEVTLSIERGQLKGTLNLLRCEDANTGTFIADANPPGEDKRPKPRVEALALT